MSGSAEKRREKESLEGGGDNEALGAAIGEEALAGLTPQQRAEAIELRGRDMMVARMKVRRPEPRHRSTRRPSLLAVPIDAACSRLALTPGPAIEARRPSLLL